MAESICAECRAKCPVCGKGNAKTDQVCPECQEKPQVARQVCELCNRLKTAGSSFCRECDRQFKTRNAGQFDEAAAVAPADPRALQDALDAGL